MLLLLAGLLYTLQAVEGHRVIRAFHAVESHAQHSLFINSNPYFGISLSYRKMSDDKIGVLKYFFVFSDQKL